MADDISQLQRLEQQFPWEDSPMQSELRRLMATLEPRFTALEMQIVDWEAAVENITQIGVARVDEVLGPLLTQLNEAAELGFLVAYATDFENTMVQDEPFGIVINSAGKELFTPTPQLTIMDIDDATNWGTATLQSYDKVTGDLTVTITYASNPIAGENWVVACGSGILPKTIEASDAAVAAADNVETLATQFASDLATLQALLTSLQEGGAVVSVAGRTGAVVLAVVDITGLQAALDAKAAVTYVNTQVAAKQAASAKLDALSALTWAANTFPAFTGASSLSAYALSAFTRDTLFSQADAAAWRTALAITSPTVATDAEVRASSGANVITPALLSSASALVTLTDATTVALDWNTGINFQVTLTANRILGNPTNGKIGQTRTVLVMGNSATARTLTFGNQYLSLPLPTLTDVTSTKWYLLTLFCITPSHFVVSSVQAK